MIFVTVGAQMPFDRMVRAVDEWAGRNGTEVFAQIGPTSWRPKHIAWTQFMDPLMFRARVEEADLIVAHAGMGSILTALELGKPILVMPRRGYLNETRNDHQMDTARQFSAQGRIEVAIDEEELIERLSRIDTIAGGNARSKTSKTASPQLINALRLFIHGGSTSAVPVESTAISHDQPAAEASHMIDLEQSMVPLILHCSQRMTDVNPGMNNLI